MALLSVIRRWYHRDQMSIREISRRTGLSRNTLRKYLRSEVVEPRYDELFTLIQAEHLAAIASHLGGEAVAPELLRRNIVVAGINLAALKGRRFRLGSALLEATGECHPCSRMEEILGPGGYNAVRGHGGITARVLEAGTARNGDALER